MASGCEWKRGSELVFVYEDNIVIRDLFLSIMSMVVYVIHIF